MVVFVTGLEQGLPMLAAIGSTEDVVTMITMLSTEAMGADNKMFGIVYIYRYGGVAEACLTGLFFSFTGEMSVHLPFSRSYFHTPPSFIWLGPGVSA